MNYEYTVGQHDLQLANKPYMRKASSRKYWHNTILISEQFTKLIRTMFFIYHRGKDPSLFLRSTFSRSASYEAILEPEYTKNKKIFLIELFF